MNKFPLPLAAHAPPRAALEPPKPSNDCGTCTCCCDVLAVIDLQKPHYARCQHLGNGCCNIYATRPAGCATYRCIWHMGFLGEHPDWRPDRLGLLFELNAQGNGILIDVYETRPGALAENQSRLRPIVQRIRRHRSLKRAVYARCWLRFIPYGADIPVDYPLSPLWVDQPQAPLPPQMHDNPIAGESTYVGPIRTLLLPRPDPPAPPPDHST